MRSTLEEESIEAVRALEAALRSARPPAAGPGSDAPEHRLGRHLLLLARPDGRGGRSTCGASGTIVTKDYPDDTASEASSTSRAGGGASSCTSIARPSAGSRATTRAASDRAQRGRARRATAPRSSPHGGRDHGGRLRARLRSHVGEQLPGEQTAPRRSCGCCARRTTRARASLRAANRDRARRGYGRMTPDVPGAPGAARRRHWPARRRRSVRRRGSARTRRFRSPRAAGLATSGVDHPGASLASG